MGSHINRSLTIISGAAVLALICCLNGPKNLRADSAIAMMVFTVTCIIPLALAAMCLALYLAGKEDKTWLRRLFTLFVYAVYIAFGVNLAGLLLFAFQGDIPSHIEYAVIFLVILPGLCALFVVPLLSAVLVYLSDTAVREPLPENIARVKKGLAILAAAITAAAGCIILAVKNLVIG